MYLLLPVDTLDTSKVNWRGISSSVNVVEFLKKQYSTHSKCFNGDHSELPLSTTGSSMTESKAANHIHFANSSIDADNLQDMLVLAIHTGRIYSIIEVVRGKSAESSLEENIDDSSSTYSYAQHFKTKYAICNPRAVLDLSIFFSFTTFS